MKHLISIIALAAAAASAAAAVKTPMQAEVKVADPQARALVSKLVVERSQNILVCKLVGANIVRLVLAMQKKKA